MTASEFAFMSLGMLLGILSGAALVEIIRSRPKGAREVRLTVTPDSVPRRRSATLAESAYPTPGPETAPVGPGDNRSSDPSAPETAAARTPVRSPVRSPLPPAGAGDPASGLPLSRIGAPRGFEARADGAGDAGEVGAQPAAGVAWPAAPVPGDPQPSGVPASNPRADEPADALPTADPDPPAGVPAAPPARSRPAMTGTAGGAVAIPVHRETDWTLQALRSAAAEAAERAIREQRLTVAAILERPRVGTGPEAGQFERAVAARSDQVADGTAEGDGTDDPPPASGEGASGSSEAPRAESADGGPAATDPGPTDAPPAGAPGAEGAPGSGEAQGSADPTDSCGEARRIADERCSVATRARSRADTAHEALRTAQRAYDDHRTRAEQAALDADPRAVRVAKETAQQAFRDARATAVSRESVEAAARDWLNEINRINRAARDAGESAIREREAASALVTSIERLTVEADAARISAEVADAACLAARQVVADCQEAAATDREDPAQDEAFGQVRPPPVRPVSGWPPVPSLGQGGGRPGEGSADGDAETELEAAFTATGAGEPAILRLVRGDRDALGQVVGALAGDDPIERRRWQFAIANLVDSIVAKAIEAAALTFPLDHAFWGGFSLEQNRDIVGALSSLGYRFDGMGGWADDRTPSQRDLSLAVGYAGLDPMRIRPWPKDHEIAELFSDVTVAADEYLTDAAGGLTLGELVSVLGRRADGLADLWNEWGRVRPLLLAGG